MKCSSIAGRVALSFLLIGTPAVAHHSFSTFDTSQAETITGTVKDFELGNPHGLLRIVASDPDGVQNEWSVQLASIGQLQTFGWTPSILHPGDKVIVQVHPLRDGTHGGDLISLTLPKGQVLLNGITVIRGFGR